MIVIASDHAGFKLKEKIKIWLKKQKIYFVDCGAEKFDKDDSFVDYAKKSIDFYQKNCQKTDLLVLICGSGVGMNIVANRNSGINAVLALSPKQAEQSRLHNNANCLCIGARNTSFWTAKKIIKKFISTDFLGGKYLERMNNI